METDVSRRHAHLKKAVTTMEIDVSRRRLRVRIDMRVIVELLTRQIFLHIERRRQLRWRLMYRGGD